MEWINIVCKTKKSKFFLYSIVFLLSTLWIASLTYNFNFLWEDSSYSPYFVPEEGRTATTVITQAIHAIFNPDILFVAGYGGRALADSYFVFFPTLFGANIIYYKIFKLFFAGLLVVLCFRFFMGNGKQEQKLFSGTAFFSFLGISFLLVLPEFWLFSLYLIDSMLVAYVLELLALWLFFFHYLPDTASSRKYAIVFVLIIFFTHLSTLIRHFGRINFLLFFMLLLCTDRKKLISRRMVALILTLFVLSVPVLGIVKTGDVLGTTGIKSHTGSDGWASFFLKNMDYIKNSKTLFFPHAFFFVMLFLFFAAAHICALLKDRKNKDGEIEENSHEVKGLKELAIFSAIWFFLTSFTFFLGRGLVFDRTEFIRFQFVTFMIPQTIFFVAYCSYVYKQYFSKKTWIKYVIILFILFAILHNTVRLNEWRGGWGAYFLGYDTVRQYVDDHAEHAILIFPFDHAAPTFFVPPSTNIHAMEQEQTNTTLLLLYKHNYTQVFIANRYELSFNESFVVNIANLTVVDNSPYGLLKKMIRKYYQEPMYVYEVRP